jgi:hypothetical protein
MLEPVRFRIRPVYHGSELLIEMLSDHRADGFPGITSILSNALRAVKVPHPDNLDNPRIALGADRYFSYWAYSGGHYEIDDDIWSLFVRAEEGSEAVICDIERALLATGQFIKESVDFEPFR